MARWWFFLGAVSSLLLCGSCSAAPVEGQQAQKQGAAGVPIVKQRHPLHRREVSKPKSTVGSRFRNLRALAQTADPQPAGKDTALAAHSEVEYLLNVTAGGHNYSLIIDTGSSDTWFVKDGFRCLNAYREPVPLAQCQFGPEFKGDFPDGQIEDQHFNISYGDPVYGPTLVGEYGYADLTVAGVKIPKQQIALATEGYWTGDGISTGILGLGMPGLTEAFVGGEPGSESPSTVVSYSPVVSTMTNSSARIAPVFSLGLSRKPAESFLALGGVPSDVKVGDWATTPLLQWERILGGSEYIWYTIQTDQMRWNSSNIAQHTARSPRVIVDSGTTLNMLPVEIAAAINNAFEPPAVYDEREGAYFTSCDATPPDFGIEIAGQVFWTDPSSMILPGVRSANGRCASGIMDTYQEPYILGDVFMQGLVTVFDIGEKKEMRIAKRLQ